MPDQWTRDYQRLRSKNEVASTVDTAVTVGLLVGLVVVIVIRVRRHDVRWHRAAFIGMAAMALSFCAYLNQLPLQEFDYPTTDSYSSFMARQLLNGIFAALGAGGFLFILTAGAEPLYREAYGSQISLGNLFRPARAADQTLLPRLDSRHLAHRHLHRIPDRFLHDGLPLRRMVARRCPV